MNWSLFSCHVVGYMTRKSGIYLVSISVWMVLSIGCTPKGAYGNTAFWEGFRGFWTGFWGRVLRRVPTRLLRSGSEKGVSRRCLERPLVEYAPLGVRPSREICHCAGSQTRFFVDMPGQVSLHPLRQQVVSTYKEVRLEDWDPAEGEEEQLKLRAYRAVVQDVTMLRC